MTRPNFLVFMTDQQRADHLGCYGNAHVRTPHIDGLAARGTVFDRCYVASPACMPNRSAIMTGRMPIAAGARMNGVPLPLDSRTFVDVLRDAGWRTALIGKSHLQNMTDNAPAWRNGLDRAPDQARRNGRDDPAYEQESIARWRDPGHAVRTPYYGFDHVELCLEHGDEVGGDYQRWLEREHPGADALRGSAHALPGGSAAPQAWRTALPERLYPSAFIGERTCAWLEQHAADRAAPFFLQCSFPDPHHPFTPPGGYWDMYRPEDVALPPSCGPARADDVPLKRALHEELAQGRRPAGGSRMIAVTPQEARAAIALNYGSISCIDDVIGTVLARLDALDLAGDTVVLFLSDHGDFMGDHGLLFKGPLHYQSLVRMPFIWADPQAPRAQRRPDLASAIDIAPTILARAGLAAPHGVQGHDLAPGAPDAPASRCAALVEEEGHRPMPGSGLPKVRTVVTQDWRLSVHAFETWGELYDLRADPHETVNLWDDPGSAATKSALLWELARSMARHADDCPLPTRMA
ncbi:Arylsulfatase [Pigmentiphaga humi]|uniref:Arylsulfatase n=1 Tax=Pigmentiphaga humi TaxID=2478468 RepID=A0A3P4AW16_9BURK|nr:sulfatase-like hydrolase/transferase [Pigmentiphaga humi]VCU68234.1 Arylsulfatase [Pigmentiphaga humi]